MDSTKLLVNFPKPDTASLYNDWLWLVDAADLGSPIAMTTFGDLFFKKADGHIYLLDTLEGNVAKFAEDEAEMQTILSEAASQKRYLLSDLVATLLENGTTLKSGELYLFKIHPILGGQATSDNVDVMSMKVVISLLGQLHRQMTQ